MNQASLEDGDLWAVLRRATHEELNAIAGAVNKGLDVFLSRDPRYKEHKNDLTKIPDVIGEYLCRAGGHAVRNLLRGGGPEYAEVVSDVGVALRIKPLPQGVLAREEAILRELTERALKKMSAAHKAELLQKIQKEAQKAVGWQEIVKGSAGLAGAGPLTYDILVGIFARGSLPLASEALGLGAGATLLGPTGAAFGILWVAHRFAGPSLRGTIPAVAGVALVRQRLLWADQQ